MKLAKMIFDAPDAIIVLNREDKVVFWNDGATKTFGFEKEEMLGEHLDNIIPEKLRQRHTQAYLKYIQTGISKYEAGHTMAVPAVHKSGQPMSIEFRISAEQDEEGNVLYVTAIVRDVTNQWQKNRDQLKRIRELEAALKEFQPTE